VEEEYLTDFNTKFKVTLTAHDESLIPGISVAISFHSSSHAM
jgi:hypothetical protein